MIFNLSYYTGVQGPHEPLMFPLEGFQNRAVSMRSFKIGKSWLKQMAGLVFSTHWY